MLAQIDPEKDTTGVEFFKLYDSLIPEPNYPFWSAEEASFVESTYIKYGALVRETFSQWSDADAEDCVTKSILNVFKEDASPSEIEIFKKATLEIFNTKDSLTESQKTTLDVIELH